MWELIQNDFINFLKSDNPNFDIDKFNNNCTKED